MLTSRHTFGVLHHGMERTALYNTADIIAMFSIHVFYYYFQPSKYILKNIF